MLVCKLCPLVRWHSYETCVLVFWGGSGAVHSDEGPSHPALQQHHGPQRHPAPPAQRSCESLYIWAYVSPCEQVTS